MNYPSLPLGRRLALAASACVASLSLVAAVAMLFDQRAELLWAGLDARHARQAATCQTTDGTAGAGCTERLALAAPNEEGLR